MDFVLVFCKISFVNFIHTFKRIEKQNFSISEESEEDTSAPVVKRPQKIRSDDKRTRPESSLIETSNTNKQARNGEEESDDSANSAELIGGDESLFAAYCHNTAVMHADFKRYA